MESLIELNTVIYETFGAFCLCWDLHNTFIVMASATSHLNFFFFEPLKDLVCFTSLSISAAAPDCGHSKHERFILICG